MVVEILDRALVLMFKSRLASEDRVAAGGGEPSRPSTLEEARTGGRWETQSWTSRETRGLVRRWLVLREEGLVVMMMVGNGSKGVEGR